MQHFSRTQDIILDEGLALAPNHRVTAQISALNQYLDRIRLFLFLIVFMLVFPVLIAVNTTGAVVLAQHSATLALGVAWIGSGILSHYRPVWGFVLALFFFLFVLWTGVPLTLEHWSWKIITSLVLLIGITVGWMHYKIQQKA